MVGKSNLEIIKDAYAAFGRGDIDAVLSLQASNVEIEYDGRGHIPWAGSFRGLDGATKFFAAIGTSSEVESFEPRVFIGQDDRVVVLGFEKIRSKRTGRSYESQWPHSFTLVGGKIVKFREYADTAAVAAAFA